MQTMFILTQDHLKLARNFYIEWQYCEYGAPAVDCNRPYGNSDVESDIANILGWQLRDNQLSDKQRDSARTLHADMTFVLQIILATGEFKASVYVCPEHSIKWQEFKSKTSIADSEVSK